MLLLALSACSSSDIMDDEQTNTDGMATVTINLSTNNATSRATDTTPSSWPAGTTGENIFSCMVVITDQQNVVKQVVQSGNITETSSHTFTETVRLPLGTYKFYSFANTSLTAPTVGSTVSYDTDTYSLSGNGFDVETNHIPMSGVQQITIASNDPVTANLKVLRMLAKVELQLYNTTSSDITISQVSLTDITSNPADGASNIYLLPQQTTTSGNYYVSNTTLLNDVATAEFTHTGLSTTVAANSTTTATPLTFYVNESLAKEPKYFVLSLTTNDGSTTRYAMLEWDEIARNDYRVIPIYLDDYKVEFVVEQYSAIGVMPEITYSAGTLNITFDTNGPFFLTPKVKQISTDTELSSGWTLDAPVADNTSLFPLIEGTSDIYYVQPTWNDVSKTIEGEISYTPGYALHRMNIQLPSGRTLGIKVQINRKDVSFSSDGTRSNSIDTPKQWNRATIEIR